MFKEGEMSKPSDVKEMKTVMGFAISFNDVEIEEKYKNKAKPWDRTLRALLFRDFIGTCQYELCFLR
jgi:hypothetical protein